MTTAERVAWFERTSDSFGYHTRTDVDSYLALVRRRVQEKCNTTNELIQMIRRNKCTAGTAITPTELRFVFLKFNVVLDQPTVDKIFKVFDTDNSGTIDFDEIAMWIMNSEFQPKRQLGKGEVEVIKETPKQKACRFFQQCYRDHIGFFKNMKRIL